MTCRGRRSSRGPNILFEEESRCVCIYIGQGSSTILRRRYLRQIHDIYIGIDTISQYLVLPLTIIVYEIGVLLLFQFGLHRQNLNHEFPLETFQRWPILCNGIKGTISPTFVVVVVFYKDGLKIVSIIPATFLQERHLCCQRLLRQFLPIQ